MNPKENLWDEIREKIFKNFALKSMNAVRAKLQQAVLYIERNPKIVKSITSFPYIAKSIPKNRKKTPGARRYVEGAQHAPIRSRIH